MEQIGIFIGILVAIATEPLFHKNYVRLVQTHEKNGGEHGGAEPEVSFAEHSSLGRASDGVVSLELYATPDHGILVSLCLPFPAAKLESSNLHWVERLTRI